MKKLTIAKKVQARAEEARALKTRAGIKTFIASIEADSKAGWGRAVQAIIDVGGPDFYAVRAAETGQAAQRLADAVTHRVEFYVDAKARNWGHYGICDAAGKLVEHGKLFDDWFSYGGPDEQSACECAAARVAIHRAKAVKDALGAAAIRLRLNVDAQWLCTLSGKAEILARDAKFKGILLEMNWIPGTINPADSWTMANGYSKFGGDWASLATPLAATEAAPDQQTTETAEMEVA